MIKFEIKNRFSGDVQFTAEIDCDEGASYCVKVGLAVKWGVENRADLSRAYLSGADLSRADLSGAYLSGAKIGEHIIIRKVAQVRRDDGYEFIGFALEDGGLLIRAGCQTRLIADYRKHVEDDYPDTPKAAETLSILDFIQTRAEAGKDAK